MKKLLIYSVLSAAIAFAVGCNKSLVQNPQIQLTANSVFTSYNGFQTYAWSLYDYFNGYNSGYNAYPTNWSSEYWADNLSLTTGANQSPYAYQTKIIPASNAGPTSSLQISNWDFSYVRTVDVMLDNISQSGMAQADQDHWRSVGYFFRALRYYDLIAAFGDVPWIEHELYDTSAILYSPRTARDTVAQNILANLEWAEANIGSSAKDGANSINQACVQFLLSRFGLFEGTWRKYHGLANADTYLQACITYSQKLMASYPSVMSSYDAVFNTVGLTGQPGIILVKQYANNILDHVCGLRYIGSTAWDMDVTHDAVQSYLCTDGRPVSTSAVYSGNATMFDEFRNRDRRLYFTVVPPYNVNVVSGVNWTYTSNPGDSEYINLMNTISTSAGKPLPVDQWAKVLVIGSSPHFKSYPGGQPQAVSQLGYLFWKPYNLSPLDATTGSITDFPIFRIEETLLNYAEAQFEEGGFDQTVADETINILRPRAGLPNMVVANIDANFDLNRDPTVDPVLWEIRRERRVELMGDGFRFNDLKRWGKGAYLNNQPLGVYVNNANYGNTLSISGGGQSGYVQYYGVPAGWLDKYYLEPVPLQELSGNQNLKQTPGW